MFVTEFISHKTLMALVAAAGYALATFLMKITAETGNLFPVAAIAVVLCVTVVAEILLMREVDLGLAYIAIIATETLLVLACTFVIGEPLSAREIAGGALVVSGAALVSF